MEDAADLELSATAVTEETLARINKHTGVAAVIVFNEDDLPIVSNTDGTTTMSYAKASRPMEKMARSAIRDIDPTNELVAIRMKTRKNEIIIVPENRNLLVVVQNEMNTN